MLGLNVPNVLEPIGLAAAGRLIWSTLLLLGGIGAALARIRRPKSPEPATWAQSMLGAVAVFGLMALAYGTVPHEWLTFANSTLKWGEDNFFVKNNSVIPFNVDSRAGADAGAALIYIVFLSVQVWLWSLWQKRTVAEPGAEAPSGGRRASRTSAFGRPLATQE